jgi:hypothetical protein
VPALITRTCDVADLDSLSGWLENNHTDLNGGLRLVAGDPKGRARVSRYAVHKKSQPKTRPKT